jgi:hypothetical protein
VAQMPGSVRIPHNLDSPAVWAYAVGSAVSLAIAACCAPNIRFATTWISTPASLTTGTVTDPRQGRLTRGHREHQQREAPLFGSDLSATYRADADGFGANYTLSRLWGNFDGSRRRRPVTTDLLLSDTGVRSTRPTATSADQRHRATLWINYGVPKATGLR